MAKKVIRSQDGDVEPPSQAEEDQPEAVNGSSRSNLMSKAKAARVALAEGVVVPKEASLYIKRKFGIEISPQQFSAEKSRLKLRAGGSDPHSNRDASSKGVEGYLAPPSKRGLSGDADLLEALETMKPLIAQLGAEKVKRMVDLLG